MNDNDKFERSVFRVLWGIIGTATLIISIFVSYEYGTKVKREPIDYTHFLSLVKIEWKADGTATCIYDTTVWPARIVNDGAICALKEGVVRFSGAAKKELGG